MANVGSLGRILVDGNGHTLYAYSPDHHSGQSKCFGVCAAAWPPLELAQGTTTPTAGPGLHSQLLGTTKRGPNLQVTYDGWPLYRWAADTRAGQATGQGLFNAGGYWYVLRSSGKLVT